MTGSWPRSGPRSVPGGGARHPRRPAHHDLSPPRYRLLRAASRLRQSAPGDPVVSYERECPACGRAVMFTQVGLAGGLEHVVDEHDCA